MKSRIAASAIAVINLCCLNWAYTGIPEKEQQGFTEVLILRSGPMVLVCWTSVVFADLLESFTGPISRGGYVTVSPLYLLWMIFGWILLAAPTIAWIVIAV